MMRKSYSLSAFLEVLGHVPNVNSIVNYAILTTHNYLLIFEGPKSYLISTESYVKDSYKLNDDGTHYLEIVYNGKHYTIHHASELIGFRDPEDALEACQETTDCLYGKNTDIKLIFSPHLAKFLLKEGYHIIDIKQKRDSNEWIPIFKIEDGFYDAINKFKSNKK